MNAAATPAIAGHIAIIDGQPTTTTQDIAEVYGKQHAKVLALVRQRMAEAGDWGVANFGETPYTNPQNGQTYTVIRMTKKGFHFIVGKFTGAKAVQHQIAFADEFERMEQALRDQPKPKALPKPKPKPPTLRGQIRALRITAQVSCGDVVMPVTIPLDSYDRAMFRDGDQIVMEWRRGAHVFLEGPVRVIRAI